MPTRLPSPLTCTKTSPCGASHRNALRRTVATHRKPRGVHWLWFHGGLSDGNSSWYLFPSGWGSIIIPPLLTALPIVWVLARKHNCEVHRCWRLGRHVTAAGQHVCRRHHPDGHLTAQAVREAHHLYLGQRPGRG